MVHCGSASVRARHPVDQGVEHGAAAAVADQVAVDHGHHHARLAAGVRHVAGHGDHVATGCRSSCARGRPPGCLAGGGAWCRRRRRSACWPGTPAPRRCAGRPAAGRPSATGRDALGARQAGAVFQHQAGVVDAVAGAASCARPASARAKVGRRRQAGSADGCPAPGRLPARPGSGRRCAPGCCRRACWCRGRFPAARATACSASRLRVRRRRAFDRGAVKCVPPSALPGGAEQAVEVVLAVDHVDRIAAGAQFFGKVPCSTTLMPPSGCGMRFRQAASRLPTWRNRRRPGVMSASTVTPCSSGCMASLQLAGRSSAGPAAACSC